jgi:hypothetical protein
MTIKYSDGKSVEAVLLSRTENTIRVAVEGAEDVTELSNVRGIWVSDECEPVSIQFAWRRNERKTALSEDDFCCSHELAARLIQLLFAGSAPETIELNAPVQTDPTLFASAC